MADASFSDSGAKSNMADCDAAGQPVSKGYLIYLLIVATGGWAMAAYDFNLQVMSLSDIAKSLHLSSTQVGLFGFFVDFATPQDITFDDGTTINVSLAKVSDSKYFTSSQTFNDPVAFTLKNGPTSVPEPGSLGLLGTGLLGLGIMMRRHRMK